jgi:hypothetical protein
MGWVQLLTNQYLRRKGIMEVKQRGDWVFVSDQQAELWCVGGQAHKPEWDDDGVFEVEAGALLRTESLGAREALAPFGGKVEVEVGEPAIPWERTILFDPTHSMEYGVELRPELIPVGLRRLEVWQVAVPMFHYETLACNVGTAKERKHTKRVIKDLRVPLYDTRLMFVKRCATSQELVKTWLEECQGGDERLAFLRALWRVKPYILALPVTWIRPEYTGWD